MEVETVTPAFEGRRSIFRPWWDEWSELKGLLLFTNTVACALGKTDMSLGGFNMQLWRCSIAYKQSRKSSNTSKFWDELRERPIAMVARTKSITKRTTVSGKNSWDTLTKRCFFSSPAPLVPLKVVYRDSVTKSCTPTLRGQGDPKGSQPFWLRL